MKTTITSILSVILALVMTLVPVFASAEEVTSVESGASVLTIYDPRISVSGQEIDLSGLAVELGLQETGVGLKVLANNVEALRAFAALDEVNGLMAAIDGMQYAFGASMEDLYSVLEQGAALLESEGVEVDALMSGSIDDLSMFTFSDESISALEEYFTELLNVISTCEPVETTFNEGENGDVAAQEISFTLTCDQLSELAARIGALIDSNETISQMLAEEIGAEEVSFSELLASAFAELNCQVECNIYVTDSGNTYVRVFFESAENTDEYISLCVDCVYDETETYYYCILSSSEEDGEFGLLVDLTASEGLEDYTDTLIDVWATNVNEAGETEDMFDIGFSIINSLDEELVRHDNVLSIVSSDSATVDFDFYYYDEVNGINAGIYADVIDYGTEDEIIISYIADYAELGVDGTLTVVFAEDSSELLNASIGVSVNPSVEEDFSFDMSGMQLIDILSGIDDEEISESITNDLMNVLMNTLGVVSLEIPELSALFG